MNATTVDVSKVAPAIDALRLHASGPTDISDTAALDDIRLNAEVVVHICNTSAYLSGWWTDLKTGQPLGGKLGLSREHPVNVPAKLMLAVTELAEMFEGFQNGGMDDHLTHRPTIEVELADVMIRIADTAGGLLMDLPGAVQYGWLQSFPMGDTFAANLMYVVLELSRAMEGFRKGKMDEMWPQFTGTEASLARAFIRCIGIANIYGLNLGAAMAEKLAYNAQRPDHKLAHRAAEGGKSV